MIIISTLSQAVSVIRKKLGKSNSPLSLKWKIKRGPSSLSWDTNTPLRVKSKQIFISHGKRVKTGKIKNIFIIILCYGTIKFAILGTYLY